MKFRRSNIRNRLRKAFTMLELIFVIVIMAILAKFGVEFLAQAYNSFIFSKINNELQSKSTYSVEFIAKRLEHRIKDSIIIRNTTAGYPGTITPLQGSAPDSNATVLEWISSDIDGFRGNSDAAIPHLPNWSGVIDLNDSNENVLVSYGTNTDKVNSLIETLSNGNSDITNAALYFIGSSLTTNPWGYEGAINEQNETMHPIQGTTVLNQFVTSNATNFSGELIYEYYKLAWSAYAVELRDYNATTSSGNLWFYYDYQPWNGESYSDNNTKSALLMQNVSSFQFRAAGSLTKIQVCVKSLLANEEYSICKEKTIF